VIDDLATAADGTLQSLSAVRQLGLNALLNRQLHLYIIHSKNVYGSTIYDVFAIHIVGVLLSQRWRLLEHARNLNLELMYRGKKKLWCRRKRDCDSVRLFCRLEDDSYTAFDSWSGTVSTAGGDVGCIWVRWNSVFSAKWFCYVSVSFTSLRNFDIEKVKEKIYMTKIASIGTLLTITLSSLLVRGYPAAESYHRFDTHI